MQIKSCLLWSCAIAILFAQLNEGATAKTTTVARKKKIAAQVKAIIVGGHTPWDTKIKPAHQKIFNDYKKLILKKLQQVHKVPSSFVPKPEKFATQIVGGINYLYLVKLPINKHAFVSIHHRAWKKDQYGKDENVQIRAQTYELNDKNV